APGRTDDDVVPGRMAFTAWFGGGGEGAPGSYRIRHHGAIAHRWAGADEPLRHGPSPGGGLRAQSVAGGPRRAGVGADAGAAAARRVAGLYEMALAVSAPVVADAGGVPDRPGHGGLTRNAGSTAMPRIHTCCLRCRSFRP